jgi:metal-responsive CopG/Arc/MetJ family transcriptional regulator
VKTRISLPDDLFLLAEQLAQELGVSRSELYTMAVGSYIRTRQCSALTERINAACAEVDTGSPSDMAMAAHRTLLEAEW